MPAYNAAKTVKKTYDDLPKNASNSMIGTTHKMDLEKIFKRSMPKSVRNYSGNLGLGTVVW